MLGVRYGIDGIDQVSTAPDRYQYVLIHHMLANQSFYGNQSDRSVTVVYSVNHKNNNINLSKQENNR